jgi:mannose-6-phosphate isomerase-like protein (cupin superfamily)
VEEEPSVGEKFRSQRMKAKRLRFGKGFRVAFNTKKAQAAEMVIAPGRSEGGPRNRHRGSDQWLYVVSGTGIAVVNRKRISLRRGTILVIERSEEHEVKNTGRAALKTINVYVPPAYTKRGGELPRAKP